MNFLIVLSLFLMSQAVLAKGSVAKVTLSSTAKNHLSSGQMFNIKLYSSFDKEWRMKVLREINSSPAFQEEARVLVETEHGAEKLPYLEHILKAQEVADTLDVELDMNVLMIAQMINHQTKGTDLATKEDLENARDEVIRHQTRRITDKDRFKAFD